MSPNWVKATFPRSRSPEREGHARARAPFAGKSAPEPRPGRGASGRRGRDAEASGSERPGAVSSLLGPAQPGGRPRGRHLAVPVTRRRPRQAHACPAWGPRGGDCPGHRGVRAREGGAGASFTLRVISSVPASRWTACVAGPVAGRPLRLTTLLVTSRGCAGWRAAAPRERLPARPVTPSPTRGRFSSMCTEYSQESHVTCERHSFQQTRKRSVLP